MLRGEPRRVCHRQVPEDDSLHPPAGREAGSSGGLKLVAISAAYGAAGSVIGPALAERLGVPFVDRGIALAVAHRLEIPVDDAIAHEEPQETSLLQKLLSGFHGAYTGAPAALPADAITPEDFHQASREALLAQAATGTGVILGRGAVPALLRDPRALRIRLTGPADRRLAQAIRLGGLPRDEAERALRNMDRAHAEYLRQFYDVDIEDPGLYHVVIDATAMPPDASVALIALAAGSIAPVPNSE